MKKKGKKKPIILRVKRNVWQRKPITQVQPNGKAYNRNKAKREARAYCF
ncbi:MAG: hypothetical protein ACH0QD_13275 [Tepidibacillus sp.]